MIHPSLFYQCLHDNGVDFFAGVPDSLLKHFCTFIRQNVPESSNIITQNEGGAVALAAGHYLATGNLPLVYMQNSGIGNAVNPLLSLADPEVYSLPMLLLIGYRGEPGVHDEPQHKKQGMVTPALVEAMRYPCFILDSEPAEILRQTKEAIRIAKEQKTPVALIVRKGMFEEIPSLRTVSDLEMTREEALEEISKLPGVLVSTTGFTSRELFEIRERRQEGHGRDFLTVGSMGHSSMIALGISLAHPELPVTCIDGDGAFLMHMGALAILGSRKPGNFTHIVMNNGVHDSVGGQPTDIGALNLTELANAAGYQKIDSVSTREELYRILSEKSSDFRFIEVKVRPGARKDLGRPTTTPQGNRDAFMYFIRQAEKGQ